MYCPNCGTKNEEQAEKCVKCERALPKINAEGQIIMPEETGQQPTGEPVIAPATPASAKETRPPGPPVPAPYQPGSPGSQYSYGYNQPPPAAWTYQSGYNQPATGYNQPGGSYNPAPAGYPYGYGYPYAPATDQAPATVGFWPRFGAWFIDSMLTGIVAAALIFVPFFVWLANFITRHEAELAGVCDWSRVNYDANRCGDAITDLFVRNEAVYRSDFINLGITMLVAGLLAFLLITLYLTLMTAKGATLGKKAFGLKVIDRHGEPPGFGRALLRMTIGYWISSFLYLGFIWIAFDPQRQGWHDKIAGTYVVKA